MYMRNVIYKMLIGCYMVAALLLVSACNDNVDIQQSYPFTVETMPVPKKLKVGETAEIRCQLHRDGRYEETKYFIRYFQPDGAGTLKMSDGNCDPEGRHYLRKRQPHDLCGCGLQHQPLQEPAGQPGLHRGYHRQHRDSR